MNDGALATVAQVYPVLLLALMWDSRFLRDLRQQSRRPRREDPVHGVRFWTKKRVRIYSLVVASLLIGDTGLAVLELNDQVRRGWVTTALLLAGLALALGTLLTRIVVDVFDATQEDVLDAPHERAVPGALDAGGIQSCGRRWLPAPPDEKQAGNPVRDPPRDA